MMERHDASHRPRRLNLGSHGVGMASGLEVRIESDSPHGPYLVIVTPGFAVTPAGEEINLPKSLSCHLPDDSDPRFVMLWYVEPDVDPWPLAGELDLASTPRVEEGFALTLERSADAGGLVLALLTRETSGWRVTEEPQA
jgi:hypothetical protein